MKPHSVRRVAVALLLAFIASALGVNVASTPAEAISAPIRIAGTGGEGVNIRPTPDTSQPALGRIPEGTSPNYICYTYGQMIGNVNVWFQVSYNGVTGYYASYYDDSHYSSEADLEARYHIPKCGAAPAPPRSTPRSGSQFMVTNASGGVYWRSTPNWSAAIPNPGHGVYSGDRVELVCWVRGGTVPPYNNNPLWYRARVIAGRGIGEGLVNDHFLDTGVNQPNILVSGVPPCNAANSPTPPPPPSSVGPTSVFYSPTKGVATGIPELHNIADRDLAFEQWATGDCSPFAAASLPNSVRTLAGWSRGRLGPIYFLHKAGPHAVSQIRTIILFDPGSKANFKASCDVRYDVNALLANWLKSNSANRLIVLTGRDSEDKRFGPLGGGSTFAGLWKFYFAGLWNQPFANRAQVCDYDGLDHRVLLKAFAWIVKNPPQRCPTAPGLPQPVSWHP